MNIKGIDPGTRLVTSAGDIVELLKVEPDGVSASVKFVEVVGSDASENDVQTISSDDIATLDGARFIGPT